MSDKLFLLGVGCQKGGTTWMHHHLSRLPDCSFADHKEYHVFDFNRVEAVQENAAKARANLARLQAEKARIAGTRQTPDLDARIARGLRLEALRASPEAYADHFDDLWHRADGIRLVGDITPSYALLGAADFAFIRELMESRGFAVRVVFLMRDPILRTLSQVRMIRTKRQKRAEQPGEAEMFADFFAQPRALLRSKYENTLRALDQSFAPDAVHLAFHEEFFAAAETRRLSDFLGITHAEPDFAFRFSHSTGQELPPDLRDRARALYDPTYRYCMDRFGAARIRALWPYA